MLEVFIPLLLLLTGFSVSKVEFVYSSEPRELSPTYYGDQVQRILVNEKVANPAVDAELEERTITVSAVNQAWLDRQEQVEEVSRQEEINRRML